jgi:hypothetical protein
MNRVTSVGRHISALCMSVTLLLFSHMAFANRPHSSMDQKDTQTEEPSVESSLKHDPIVKKSAKTITQGRKIFRSDIFGDEQFWGDTLHLHQAIEGANFGGVGSGVTPEQALKLGLKVDVGKLPPALVQKIANGKE